MIAPGDVLLVAPGDVVPVDGAVGATPAMLDEWALTGEPLPVERRPGESVRSGVVNAVGPFDLVAAARAADSIYAGSSATSRPMRRTRSTGSAPKRPARTGSLTASSPANHITGHELRRRRNGDPRSRAHRVYGGLAATGRNGAATAGPYARAVAPLLPGTDVIQLVTYDGEHLGHVRLDGPRGPGERWVAVPKKQARPVGSCPSARAAALALSRASGKKARENSLCPRRQFPARLRPTAARRTKRPERCGSRSQTTAARPGQPRRGSGIAHSWAHPAAAAPPARRGISRCQPSGTPLRNPRLWAGRHLLLAPGWPAHHRRLLSGLASRLSRCGQGWGTAGVLGVPLLGAGALQVTQLGGDRAQQPAPVRAHHALGAGQRGEHGLAYRAAGPLPAPAAHGRPDQTGKGI